MKLKILGILLLIIAVSGCINEESLNEDNSNLGGNISGISNKTIYHHDAGGYCYHVVDGDTIDVKGVGRVRLVGINTPEKDERGYLEAKNFVKKTCLGKTVYLDIDDAKHYDKYGRVLAVVYAGDVNINAALLKGGYADVMYIPPSEFNLYSWT